MASAPRTRGRRRPAGREDPVSRLFERLLVGMFWRLERSDRGIAVLRAMRWVLAGLFPYTPAHTPLPLERTRAYVPVAVRDSTITGAGQGLFVLQSVAAGTVIGEYCGDAIDSVWQWLRLRNLDYVARTANPSVRIDAAAHPEAHVRYINHSADPRARSVRFESRATRKFCVATRDIAAGEELFIDYGDFYWKITARAARHAGSATAC
jgi:hypothetical protein